jgi:hypothetical protein
MHVLVGKNLGDFFEKLSQEHVSHIIARVDGTEFTVRLGFIVETRG